MLRVTSPPGELLLGGAHSGRVGQQIKETLKAALPEVRKPFFDIEHSF